MGGDIYRVLGRRVREERQSAGLTLERLGEMAGITGAFVAHIEAGRKHATLETVRKISRALGLPIGELLAEPSRSGPQGDLPCLRSFARLIKGKSRRQKKTILRVVRASLDMT